MHTPSRIAPQAPSHHWALAGLVLAACLACTPAQADLGDFIANLLTPGPRTTFEVNTPSKRISARIHGTVTFNAAEDDVESITGKAVLQERRDFRTTRVVFEPDGAGGVKRTWSVDGKVRPWDAEAKRWLAGFIPAVMRETAMDADKRVRRIHARGGADAVISEIERIESGYARSRYFNGLVTLGTLGDDQLKRALPLVRAIDSDYERRTALVALVDVQPASPVLQSEVLGVVAAMQSDYEQRTVLVSLAPRLLPEPAVTRAWQLAIGKLQSDYEARMVIESMAQSPTLNPGLLDIAIQSTLALDSDYEHATALTALLKHMNAASPTTIAAFLKSTQRIGSDNERSNVLIATAERVKLDKGGYAALMHAMSGMGSDHDIGRVLTAVARTMPADAELVASYRRVARKLGDHQRGQAERALDRLNM